MTETEQAGPRRWIGYLCPTCDAVFRLESGNAGRRAVCPHCDSILRVPQSKPTAAAAEPRPSTEQRPAPAPPVKGRAAAPPRPPSPSPAARQEPEEQPLQFRKAEPLPEGAELRMRKKWRHGKAGEEVEPEWEKPLHKRRSMAPRTVIAIAAIGLLVALFGGSAILMQPKRGPVITPEAGRESPGEPVIIPESNKPAAELEKFADMDLEGILVRIEESVERFFAAKSIEELADTVRGGETTKDRMKAYYADRPIHPVGLRAVAEEGELQTTGALSSVVVLMDDYSSKAIAVEEIDGRFLVDWESWVGWSEMKWDELMEKKPTKPVLMRVRRSVVDYYNFDFIDDRKWQSFRLEPDNRQTAIFGYVPRNSVLEQQVSPDPGKFGPETMIVTVRYPEGATRGDQVIIDSFVSSGWVLSSE